MRLIDGIRFVGSPENGAVAEHLIQTLADSRLLLSLGPGVFHVALLDGRIVASGGAELAKKLEAEDYDAFIPAGVGSEDA